MTRTRRSFATICNYSSFFTAISLSFALLAPKALGAVDISASGSLPRPGDNTGFFDLDLVISNVDTSNGGGEIASNDAANEIIKKRVKIEIKDVILSMKYSTDDKTDKVYGVPNGGSSSRDSNGNYTFTFAIRITELYQALQTTISGAGNSFLITVHFYNADGTSELQKKEFTATIDNDAPNEAPLGFTVESSNKSLIGKWNYASTINFLKTNGKAAPKSVQLFWIARDKGNVDLKGYTFGESSDTETTCTFDASAPSGDKCITCAGDDTKTYLSSTQTNPAVGTARFKNGENSSAGQSDLLEIGKEYVLFASYYPFGLARTDCVIAIPSENASISELNGEASAKHVDTRCFITTAAYGSPFHKNLGAFRWFRDGVLLKTEAGREFVEWYYENSQTVALFVSEHPLAAKVVRGALWAPYWTIRGLNWASEHPSWFWADIGAILLFSWLCFTWIKLKSKMN